MKEQLYIKSYCHIRDNSLWINGEEVHASEGNFASFTKSVLQYLGVTYPKFFKMDKLSKLAFLGAEALLKDYPDGEKEIALVFSNASSCLDTDVAYQKSIENKEQYFPSPAVFVYTLPNICLGEISIRHKLYSENSFFVSKSFNAALCRDYTQELVFSGKAKEVLCGWVEVLDEKYELFLYLVSLDGMIKHTTEDIITLYKKYR